jgi:pseudouridine synthase
MHKPLDVVCSHREPGRSVYEILPRRWQAREPALSTIGRLDKDTSGLLLITDDGLFLHRVISPKSHVAKRYLATLDRPLRGDEAAVFASGTLMLDNETDPLAPAILEPVGEKQALLTITEGRYHQVRRMFAAVGNHVTALHRDRIGGLELPAGLAPGTYTASVTIRTSDENVPGEQSASIVATFSATVGSGRVGDLNGDGRVDGADLGLLLSGWGQPGLTDLNGDGTTDGADLGVLLSSWG